ncbi:hypothetical protein B0T42_11925 [Rathayibacter sp. VKM Ac-2630]|nr:hypothetical protein B0T42_11925 [Rathayibacter sp. VKM Ac-2630]
MRGAPAIGSGVVAEAGGHGVGVARPGLAVVAAVPVVDEVQTGLLGPRDEGEQLSAGLDLGDAVPGVDGAHVQPDVVGVGGDLAERVAVPRHLLHQGAGEQLPRHGGAEHVEGRPGVLDRAPARVRGDRSVDEADAVRAVAEHRLARIAGAGVEQAAQPRGRVDDVVVRGDQVALARAAREQVRVVLRVHAVAVHQAHLETSAAQPLDRRGQVGGERRVVEPEHQPGGPGVTARDRLQGHVHAPDAVAVSGHRDHDLAVGVDHRSAREAVGEVQRQELDAERERRGVVDRTRGEGRRAALAEPAGHGPDPAGRGQEAGPRAHPPTERGEPGARSYSAAERGEGGMHRSRITGAVGGPPER